MPFRGRSHLETGPGAPVGLLGASVLAGIVALTTFMAVVGAESPIVDRPATFVALRTVFCVGLVGIALILRTRGAHRRLAALMIGIAYALAIAGLTEVDSPTPFAIGRLAIPVAILLTMYFCLAYPSGYLEDRRTSLWFFAALAVIVVLDLANVLLSHAPPLAGPFVHCTDTRCPGNPLNVVSLGHGASRVLSSLLGLAMSAAVIGVAISSGRRALRASRLQRRSLAPLFAWTIVTALAFGSFVGIRAVDEHARLLAPGAVVVAAIIASMPLAIALGIARGRFFSARALEDMIANLGEHPSLTGLQRTMSRAFADPTLQLLFWRPSAQRYVDVTGSLVDVDLLHDRRILTEFTIGDEKVLAALHDPTLAEDRDVLDAAGRAVRLALQNARLERALSTSIGELEASRKRMARAADEERRRIEQDLHDGAQQALIALRIKLGLLEEMISSDPARVASGIADAGRRVDAAVEEIRDLAKGIYPPTLRDFGLSRALAAVARDSPLEVSFRDRSRRRFGREIETAAYFCCVEALQNVAKHCGGGTRVELRLSERAGRLQFSVTDDGPGFDPAAVNASRGITGMHDRLDAIGGAVTITSSPGSGTTVTGVAPGVAPS